MDVSSGCNPFAKTIIYVGHFKDYELRSSELRQEDGTATVEPTYVMALSINLV